MKVSKEEASTSLEIDLIDRWQVYQRLQDLSIGCRCRYGDPLQVYYETPAEIIQIWSVVQQVAGDRKAHIERLNRCWKQVICR